MPVIPPGMVFDPNDVEILSLYLPMFIDNGGNVAAGLGEFSHLIKVSNVYSCKPEFFFSNDEPDALGRGDQRFVFSRREMIARKNPNGKRPRRDVHGSEGGGFWRSSTGDKSVMDDQGRVLGFLNVLNFYEYHEVGLLRKAFFKLGGGGRGLECKEAKAKGVEPRNLRKLVENGIQGVAELKQLYMEKGNLPKEIQQMVMLKMESLRGHNMRT
ncbi:hypothetical protein V6N13_014216 [Hibiscus sabdariffa]